MHTHTGICELLVMKFLRKKGKKSKFLGVLFGYFFSKYFFGVNYGKNWEYVLGGGGGSG